LTLVQDHDERVRQAVAGNPHTPREVLQRLAQDRGAGVRTRVAEHLQTAPEMFSLLAQDHDEEVRQAVARNGQTPPELLATLAQDAKRKVRRSATIVRRLLAEMKGPWREQKWREKLREFLIFLDRNDEKMGDRSPERHVEWVGSYLGSQDI